MDNTKVVFALNCAIYIFMFGVGLITPLLPGKILNLSGSPLQVGWLASAFAFAYIFFQVPIGLLADKFGYKIFIALGYFVCAAAGFMYLIADSSLIIFGGRVIQGAGEAPLWALAPALLSILNPANKARTIGYYNASLHMGLTSGSVLGLVVYEILTESQIFMIFSLLCIIAGFLTMICGREKTDSLIKAKSHSGAIRREFLQLIKTPMVLSVLSGITVYGAGYGIYLTIIPSFFLERYMFNHNSVGWLFIGFYVGLSIAQLVGGYIADIKGRVIPMVIGLILFAFGQTIFHYFNSGSSIGFLSLASFGLGLFLIGSITFLNDQVGNKSKGLISGTFYLFWGCGYFTGPLILGYLGEHGLYRQGFTTLGVLSGFIALFILISNVNHITADRYC